MSQPAPTATTDLDFEDEADAGPGDAGPQRRCLVTRDHGGRAHMLRFVVGPGETLVPDLAATLPGRGLWLSARQDVVEAAAANRAFSRAARRKVTVPDDLVAQVRAGLQRRFLDTLGLARRAGQSVSGFQKAQGWLITGRVGLVIQACDGSVDEAARFLRWPGGQWTGKRIAPLPACVLGGVFGRDHAVHIVVAPGRLAGMLQVEAERLAGFAAPPIDHDTLAASKISAGSRGNGPDNTLGGMDEVSGDR